MVLRPQTDEVPLRRSRRNLELLTWGGKVAHERNRRFDQPAVEVIKLRTSRGVRSNRPPLAGNTEHRSDDTTIANSICADQA